MDIFKPDPFRYSASSLFVIIITGLFLVPATFLLMSLLLSNSVDFESILLVLGVPFLTVAILELFNLSSRTQSLAIILSDEDIIGPSRWTGKRIEFNLNSLDKESSHQRSWIQALLGYQILRSRTGQQIMFAKRMFDKKETVMLLGTLGLA